MEINKILKKHIMLEGYGIGGNIDEAIITLGNKLYPTDGNGVIFAGGSGSGKGFIKDNLLGIEGKVIDSDYLKTLYMNSVKLRNSLKNDYGLDTDSFDFKNPEHVEQLHRILITKGIGDDRIEAIMRSFYSLTNKPNLIFDTTLSSVTNFYNVASIFHDIGYVNQKIHLVWVLTDFETAQSNNQNRDRVVPDIIFNDIHKGVSRTMKEILSMKRLTDLIDGDIVLVFNNRENDTLVNKSDNGGKYIEKANYVKLKEAGKPPRRFEELDKELIAKINSYIHPDSSKW